jgi:hypothetical protein
VFRSVAIYLLDDHPLLRPGRMHNATANQGKAFGIVGAYMPVEK